MKNIKILAIETSCDETAVAVVKNGQKILSNIIASQIHEHQKYGGIVPEIASRKHIESILSISQQALEEANLTLKDIDANIKFFCPAKEAWLTNMNEERREKLPVNNHTVSIRFGHKKIVTCEVLLER